MKKIHSVSMVILSGGHSSRMGMDKADLIYRGKTFLQIQIEKGISLGIDDILISGSRRRDCRFPAIPDRFTGRGPLAGLEACLREAKGDCCLVLSVDSPLVPVSELENLLEVYKTSEKRAAILKAGDREQPLIGVYDVSLADEMAKEIQERKGSVFAMLNRITYETYEGQADTSLYVNINDPETYHRMNNPEE